MPLVELETRWDYARPEDTNGIDESMSIDQSMHSLFGASKAAADLLGMPPTELVMIGDDIRGDIEGAQKAGIPGLLVRTGKFSPADLKLGIEPAAVLDSVATLPDWWRTRTA